MLHTHKCSYLIFLQGDLSHLSVPYKGARHLVNSLRCAHFYEVVGGEVACLVPHLSLKAESEQTLSSHSTETLENKNTWNRTFKEMK